MTYHNVRFVGIVAIQLPLQAMDGAVGLPVGIQVVAPWYEDEVCLRVMKEVEGAADFHVMNK